MKVFVTGATGFIGGAIVRAAAERGWQVRAMRRDKLRAGAVSDLADEGLIEWKTADLLDTEAVGRAMQGCHVVFHAAAYYPVNNRDVQGQIRLARAQTESVLEAVRQAGTGLLIFTSSLSTIGSSAQTDRLSDESFTYEAGSVPVAYFDIKIAMEQAVLESGVPAVVLCPTTVFGPGDVKPTSGILLINVARGRMPFYVDGQNNVVDVRDVAATQLSAVDQGQVGSRYVVGGENMSYRQILTVAAQQSGRRPPWLRLSPSLVRVAGKAASQLGILGGDALQAISYWQPLDDSRARIELGHRSRPFSDTVRDSLAWFREHHYL